MVDRTQVQKLVDAAAENYGRVDVMINNAGIMPQALLEKLRVSEWEQTIDVNLKGVLYGGRGSAALYEKAEVRPRHPCFVGCGTSGRPRFAVYAAAKFGVRVLS